MDAIAAMANANLRTREDDASARAISTSILRHFHAASAEADAADSDVVLEDDDDDVKLLDDKLRTISLIVPIEPVRVGLISLLAGAAKRSFSCGLNRGSGL